MTEQEYLNAKIETDELNKKLVKLRREINSYEEENCKNVSNKLVGNFFLDTCGCYCIGIKYEGDTFFYIAVDTDCDAISTEDVDNPRIIQGYADSIISKEEFIKVYRSVTTKIHDKVSNAIGTNILSEIMNGEK